jgi:hypothetical protein
MPGSQEIIVVSRSEPEARLALVASPAKGLKQTEIADGRRRVPTRTRTAAVVVA